MLLSDKYEKIAAPESLADLEDAYGIQVSGTSMEPAFKPGDTVFVHPYAALVPGCDVVLRKPEPERLAIIRQLLSENAIEWRVFEYRTSQESILPKAEWPRCEKIFGKYSRQ
jgi:phage repressor protein C with HTH and peptisase S24 domain